MDQTTKCKHCLSDIPDGASVCKVCRVHQGTIRGNLQHWQIGATFLVALATLATSIHGMMTANALKHAPLSKITLTQPQIRDGIVTLTATNVGDAPGLIEQGTIRSDMLGGFIQLIAASPDDEFVGMGAKRVTFHFHERLSVDQQREAQDKAKLFSSSEETGATVSLTVVESDGTHESVDFKIPISAFDAIETERMEKEHDALPVTADHPDNTSDGVD